MLVIALQVMNRGEGVLHFMVPCFAARRIFKLRLYRLY